MNILREICQTVVLFMCLSFPTSAEAGGGVYLSRDKDVLIYNAQIDDASFFKMTTLYKGHKFKQINITSPGGDYDIGMKIAKFIYENKINVYVPKYCASACTFAFFVSDSKNRDIAPDATIGLHNISFATSALKPQETYVTLTETMAFAREVSVRTGMMMALYSSNGVPGDVLLEVANKHDENIVNVTRKDLVAWGTIIK